MSATLQQRLKAIDRWRDSYNPLRGLTIAKAVALVEDAQRGIMADLQWTYEAIEQTDADLLVIVERSTAALDDYAWRVRQVSDETTGFDPALAQEQEGALRQLYERVDNLQDAIAHLELARFRGYAHLAPWRRQDADPASVHHLQPLQQWNLVRDGYAGPWAWNPQARSVPYASIPTADRLEPSDYILRTHRRSVDRVALVKHVRASTAEKDWDAYVEIYGIPGAFVIMPPNVPAEKEADFLESAQRAAEGGSGALPNGADVKFATDARGDQPFQPRLEWLQKQLVLAGTGGLLTMLAESGSGTLAGSVHEQAFRQIGRGLARRVSEAFQRQIDKPLLARAFPGKPVLAYFEIAARQERDPSGILDDAVKARTAVDLPEPISPVTRPKPRSRSR
jgi:phage gp29-like protein